MSSDGHGYPRSRVGSHVGAVGVRRSSLAVTGVRETGLAVTSGHLASAGPLWRVTDVRETGPAVTLGRLASVGRLWRSRMSAKRGWWSFSGSCGR